MVLGGRLRWDILFSVLVIPGLLSSQEEMIQVVQRFKKKPPNKLKPLGKIEIRKNGREKTFLCIVAGGSLPLQHELSSNRRLSQTCVLSDSLKNM